MKVDTSSNHSLADAMVAIPSNELEIIDKLIDWQEISNYLSRSGIRTDYLSLSLFKALLLQTWHNLSDSRLSSSLSRDLVYMQFCKFSISSNKPDAATICRYRNKLVKQNLHDKLLDIINKQLELSGHKLNLGSHVIADASLVASARRPKRHISTEETSPSEYTTDEVEYSDDKEASWVTKGKKQVYGYASYMASDADGYVETVLCKPANESETKVFPELVNKLRPIKGRRLLYDKGVDSLANHKLLKSQGFKDGIMVKRKKGKQLPRLAKKRNKLISSTRGVIERVFGTMKRTYTLARAKYLGLDKMHGQSVFNAICYNLKRAANIQKTIYAMA